jgi:protein TonB
MFEQTFVTNGGAVRKPWTVAVSFAGQLIFVAAIVAVPLLSTAKIAWLPTMPIYAPKPIQQVKQVIEQARTSHATAVHRVYIANVLSAPQRIPDKIAMISDEPAPSLPGAVTGSDTGGIPFSIGTALTEIKPLPPTPPAAPAAPQKQVAVKVGGAVQAAKLLHQIKPAYPQLARSARISGTVRLSAIIAMDGNIKNLRVIEGHPLLTQAALDAVRQWTYKPTLLNGEAVEVITEIDVNFTLAN